MRVLITGAAGFIGSHLGDRLTADGHQVTGIDNYLTGNYNSEFDAPNDWLIRVGDIRERQLFYSFCNADKPELIIHCAASYSDPNLWHRDAETNVLGTINATLAARHHGARLIYFNTALPPISSYAISKIAGQQYIEQSGVPHLIFRLANIYGPRNLSGPIPTFYKRIRDRVPCTVVDTTRDIVFINDLVECVTQAIREELSGVYDLCSGQRVSILDQYRAVLAELSGDTAANWMEQFDEKLINGPPVVPPSKDDVQTQVDPAKGVPGWGPVVPLSEGVRAAVDWYRRNNVDQTFTHLSLKG